MERLVIWKLDNLLDLQTIDRLLRKNYNKEIEFFNEEEIQGQFDVERSDKTLNNKWLTLQGDEKFNIKSIFVDQKEVKYIVALGNYEYGYGKKRSIIGNILLERNMRIFNKVCRAIFFEYEGYMYVALETVESHETLIRGNLMGQTRGNKDPEWGTIEVKSIPHFTFESDFFYWLLTKKGENLNYKETEKLEIIDVSAIAVLSEKDTFNSTSEGAGLLDSCLSALSVLSANESIERIGLKVKISNYELIFQFNKFAQIFIDEEKSFYSETIEKDGDITENITFYFEDSTQFILNLYTVVFPILINNFTIEQRDTNWTEKIKDIQKGWALNVVKKLIDHNEITIGDIQQALESETEPNEDVI